MIVFAELNSCIKTKEMASSSPVEYCISRIKTKSVDDVVISFKAHIVILLMQNQLYFGDLLSA